MEAKLLRQIRQLQICVLVLFVSTMLLGVNAFHPAPNKAEIQDSGTLRLIPKGRPSR